MCEPAKIKTLLLKRGGQAYRATPIFAVFVFSGFKQSAIFSSVSICNLLK